MFARIVQITAKPGQGPNLSQHTRDRTINVLKQQPGFIDMLVVKSDTDPNQFVVAMVMGHSCIRAHPS
jgi:heme-degrading monooxygenase HmoA